LSSVVRIAWNVPLTSVVMVIAIGDFPSAI
jgi:hypothetical protein